MQDKISPLHTAARDYAEAGLVIFPCWPGTKKPATANGFKDASSDLRQIDAWWIENPDYNIGFSPHTAGLSVVDIDGEAGLANWAKLVEEHGGVPDTYTVRSPRGGLHLYFKGELPGSQSKLAEHIDTRGVGSYALLPPSMFQGKFYTLEDDRLPAIQPEWLLPLIRVRPKVEAKPGIELDKPSNVARATKLLQDYVKRGHIAIEGARGDERSFAVAAEMKDLGLSPEKTLEVMLEYWNPHCVPPWDEDELWVKVRNANANPQIEAGAYAVPSAQEAFGVEVLGKLATLEPEPEPGGCDFKFKLWTLEELEAEPEPTWLLPEFMTVGSTGIIYGPGGGYKTFLAIHKAAEVASAGGQVLWLAAEGAQDIAPRLRAWKLLRDWTGPLPIRVAKRVPLANDQGQLIQFVEEARKQGSTPSLIVIDTAAKMMVGLNENDSRDSGLFIAAMEGLAQAFGSAVLAIHHTGKNASAGMRGSSALAFGVDSAFYVEADTMVQAAALHVERQRSVKRRERPWAYEGRDIGGSLAFQEIELSEYRKLTTPDDMVSPAKVGAALGRMEARFPVTVTTHALATELHHAAEDEPPEATQAAIGRLVKLLKVGAKGKLAATYATTDGREITWGLP